MIEVFRYPTGTKLAGIICVHKIFQLAGIHNWEWWLAGNRSEARALCGDGTLKNLVIMTHDWKKFSPVDEDKMKQAFPKEYSYAMEDGAQVYYCTNASELDLGALRAILGGRPVVPKVQQEEQNRRVQEEADGLRKYIAEMQSKEESRRKEMDVFKKQIAEMQSKEIARREMERRAREEVDGLRKRIAEMQSKLEEDRHRFGKASATYLNFPHFSAHPI